MKVDSFHQSQQPHQSRIRENIKDSSYVPRSAVLFKKDDGVDKNLLSRIIQLIMQWFRTTPSQDQKEIKTIPLEIKIPSLEKKPVSSYSEVVIPDSDHSMSFAAIPNTLEVSIKKLQTERSMIIAEVREEIRSGEETEHPVYVGLPSLRKYHINRLKAQIELMESAKSVNNPVRETICSYSFAQAVVNGDKYIDGFGSFYKVRFEKNVNGGYDIIIKNVKTKKDQTVTSVSDQELEELRMSCQALVSEPLDLSGQDCSGMNLYAMNFKGAICKGTNFSRASLEWCDFSEANCEGAIFSEADLSYSKFEEANCAEVKLDHALMRRINFSNSDFRGANFVNTKFDEVIFSGAKNIKLVENFSGADFTRCDFSNTNLQEVDFSNKNLLQCIFHGANVERADFSDSSCYGIDWSGANMTGIKYNEKTKMGNLFVKKYLSLHRVKYNYEKIDENELKSIQGELSKRINFSSAAAIDWHKPLIWEKVDGGYNVYLFTPESQKQFEINNNRTEFMPERNIEPINGDLLSSMDLMRHLNGEFSGNPFLGWQNKY